VSSSPLPFCTPATRLELVLGGPDLPHTLGVVVPQLLGDGDGGIAMVTRNTMLTAFLFYRFTFKPANA
jgi:hypothetical protein